ncbi:hypothetical protein D3C72_1767140 [compost metagenome]
MAGQVRLQRRADQFVEDGQVEGDGRARVVQQGRLQRGAVAADQPVDRATARRVVARPVRGHWAVSDMGKARLVEQGQQAAGVGIAEVALLPGCLRQLRQNGLGDAARAVAAAREPDGVQARIIGELDEGGRANGVVAAEVAMRLEDHRMEDQLDVAARIGLIHPGLNGRAAFGVQTRAGVDDADLEGGGRRDGAGLRRRPC